MHHHIRERLLKKSLRVTRHTARVCTRLLVSSLAVSAVHSQTTVAPTIRPPTTAIVPQTIVQSVQIGAKEVVVGAQSLGLYNVGALTPQPVTLTSQGALSAAQTAVWSDWYKAVVQGGQTQPRDVIIIARGSGGREVQRWTLQRAWPVKLSYSMPAPGNPPTLMVSLVYANVVSSL